MRDVAQTAPAALKAMGLRFPEGGAALAAHDWTGNEVAPERKRSPKTGRIGTIIAGTS